MDKKEIERLKAEQPDHKHAFEMKAGGMCPVHQRYRSAAKAAWHSGGEIEIDDDAVVSIADYADPAPGEKQHHPGGIEGAYVQAWVWVDAEEIEEKK